ncbi:MAG TPA: hypothetical protein VNM14_09685 [Planctomycetota bacterium]|nr:hypothetical protein [Planctomycetota bacterium]
MGEYKFQCPQCGRSYKANKDLGGRLKRCGKCRGTFTIKRTAAVKAGAAHPPDPVVLHDPELPIDQVFNALHDWQQTVPSLPGSFAREITFGHFDPAYRVTLEVTIDADGRRSKQSAHRETVALPPELGDDVRKGARKVVDLSFEHSADLAKMLADKPPVVRSAAEQLAKELRPPAGGKFAGRHLVVEHLQVWQAHWVFHQSEGSSWFFGRPLRVYLPDPPKKSSAPAVLGTLAALAILGAVGWVLWQYDLVRPGERKEPEPVVVVRTAPPAKAQPLQFAKDGLLQLDDGTFLRGALERRDEAVVVGTKSIAPWQIETLHIDAPVFIRGELRHLDGLEGKVAAALENKATASRESLVGLFLEVHRQRERWTQLEALCGAAELPTDPKPQKRIEAIRLAVEKLLEAAAPPAAAVAPVAPAPGVKPPEPSPAAALASTLLARMTATIDDASRAQLLGNLQALKGEKLPQSDLLAFVHLWLSRSDADSGLIADRVRVKTAQMDTTFDGAFDKQSEFFVKLKTFSGQELIAYKEKDAWVARIPGGLQFDGAQIHASARTRTAAGERLKAALEQLPPSRWMTAPAAEHLRAAKSAAESDRRTPNDRGLILLRALAAGHAGTALRIGTPAEILEARGLLHGLGYTQAADGRWERPEDRRALQMGQLLRDGKGEEARALLPGSAGTQEFLGTYRAAAVQVVAPMRGVEDVGRAEKVLDLALGQAATPGESRHLLALKSALTGFGICPSCGGSPAKICMTCRGKGTRTEACASCGGLGYKVTVGVGATGHKTCEVCGGKPIKGTRPCEICQGKGTRSCAKCQGATRIPTATDLTRTRPCARCNGSGGHGDAIVHPCTTCAAMGMQLVPAGATDSTLP